MRDMIELVELRTKIASVIPFVVGLLYSIWTFGNFNAVNMMLFFVGMVCFDMATTVMSKQKMRRIVKKKILLELHL